MFEDVSIAVLSQLQGLLEYVQECAAQQGGDDVSDVGTDYSSDSEDSDKSKIASESSCKESGSFNVSSFIIEHAFS